MTDAVPAERRAAVVANPAKVDVGALRAAVEAAEAAHGWAPSRWHETTEDSPGTELARLAVADGASLVLAAGGDGTVRAVAEGLRGTGVPLGLVPVGTGNLLARNLGLPLGPLGRMVEIAFGGDNRVIDMGLADYVTPEGTRGECGFLVIAGIGLDAQMVVNTDPVMKRRVGWLAYVGAIIRSLRDREQVRLRFSIDGGEPRAATVHTLLVGNCGILPGNLVLLPEAKIDDGVFDVVALRPQSFAGWLQIGFKVVWENGVLRRSEVGRRILAGSERPIRALRYSRGQDFRARLSRPDEFEVDGDVVARVVAVHARVDPGALVVRVAG